jgi:hypothetical protein
LWCEAINAAFCPDRKKPLHVSNPERSAFFVVSESEHMNMSIEKRREIWLKEGKLAIIQTQCHIPQSDFEKSLLATLTGRLDSVIEVQGMSLSGAAVLPWLTGT